MRKLHIHSIEGKGDLDKESVWLDVVEDIPDLAFYMLCDTTYLDDGHISNELRHIYWFPRKRVKKGDRINLSTKAGKATVVANDKRTMTYRFYWNLCSPVWNQNGDCAVLLKAEGWRTKRAWFLSSQA